MTPKDLLAVLRGFVNDANAGDLGDSVIILDLLGRFYGAIVEGLEFESFEPVLQQTGVILTDPSAAIISWCNGFMLGIDHHTTAWESWFKDARRTKAISLITGTSDLEILRQAETAIGEETAWTTITMISELVPLIHAYWAFESALNEHLADGE
jgi:uncharacterized protein UPF0149